MSEIVDIFKTPIYFKDLNLNTKSMRDYCISLKEKNTSVVKSNVGGWQSDNLDGTHLPLNDLFLEIEKHCSKFTNKIGLKDILSLDNAWININYYKDFNSEHIHCYSKISGVFYIQTPKDCGNIEFVSNDSNIKSYDWNDNTVKDTNNYTSGRWYMPSLENRLILFPSWLKHNVQPNLNPKEERISISFNLI